MKFILQAVSKSGSSARLGRISNVDRLPDFELTTPHVFLYTKGGSVPHISYEVLQMITQEKLGLVIPIPNIAHIEERTESWKTTIADFAGLKEYLSYCTIIDPGQARLEGHHVKDVVSVWSRHGKKEFTDSSYMQFVKNLKPDLFLSLCDGDTTSSSSNKRVLKSVSNSLDLFEKCNNFFNGCSELKSSAMLGSLVGGYNVENRERCSEAVAASGVTGVVIDGLSNYGKEVADILFADIKPYVEASLKYIPSDKLRIIHGCWNPKTILGLVDLGVDVFDTSYACLMTDQGKALIFPNAETLLNGKQNGNMEEPEEKKSRLQKTSEPSQFTMSLREPTHAESFYPISEFCTCLTCKKHTRAYIHHLLNVNELLASVLLMIHNLHHLLEFFKTIQAAVRADKLDILQQNL